MENSRKVKKTYICPTCKGNGFLKADSIYDEELKIVQCWDCDSEGEFYETTDVNYIDDGNSTKLH